MKREDLLKMLDLTGKDAAPVESTELSITPADTPTAPTSSNLTALDLDEWALRKGSDLLTESERLQDLEVGEHAVADFYGAAFLPDPELLPDCADPCRHQFLAQLFETPEFHALHTTTTLQETASGIAAVAFAEQFVELRKEEEEKPGEDSMGKEMATLRAVGKAVAEARKEVEEIREAREALGMGAGSPGSNDARVIAALYRRVRSNPILRRICELAGRYRRVAQSRQRWKTTHGMDDVVGVVMDGELSRLLPQELARLAIPEFEDDTLRRLIERQVMCRDYRAVERVAKGPVIVSVDESGSMSGDKVHTAKALALALAWVARQQNRWCALVAYSGDSGERLLALPPGRWDESRLADWLCAFIGGGSTLDVPVREMPRYYQELGTPRGTTDVLFITDALCEIEDEVNKHFLEWKRSVQARLITLVIGSRPGDLTHISDEVHQVSTLSVTEEAVERVLSL